MATNAYNWNSTPDPYTMRYGAQMMPQQFNYAANSSYGPMSTRGGSPPLSSSQLNGMPRLPGMAGMTGNSSYSMTGNSGGNTYNGSFQMPQYSSVWQGFDSPWTGYAADQGKIGDYYQGKVPGMVNRLNAGNQGDINRHLGNMLGGQRQLMQNYVNQAAGAGIQRGGMNVAGGSPLASVLAQQANKGLASQYAGDYGNATQFANQDRSALQQLLSQMQQGANAAYGNQATGLGGAQRDWLAKVDSYNRDVANNARWMENEAIMKAMFNQANQKSGFQGLGGKSKAPTDPMAERLRQAQMQSQLSQIANQNQMNDLALANAKMANQQQGLDLAGNTFKQDAWMSAMAPYKQIMNSFLGLGGAGYGGMNNASLGEMKNTARVWGGSSAPTQRSFNFGVNTGINTQAQIPWWQNPSMI